MDVGSLLQTACGSLCQGRLLIPAPVPSRSAPCTLCLCTGFSWVRWWQRTERDGMTQNEGSEVRLSLLVLKIKLLGGYTLTWSDLRALQKWPSDNDQILLPKLHTWGISGKSEMILLAYMTTPAGCWCIQCFGGGSKKGGREVSTRSNTSVGETYSGPLTGRVSDIAQTPVSTCFPDSESTFTGGLKIKNDLVSLANQ